jgi:hypothetical protein
LYCFTSTHVNITWFTFILGHEEDQRAAALSTKTQITLPANRENYWIQVFKTISNEIIIEEWKSVIRHLLGKFCHFIACICSNYALCIFKLFTGKKERSG